jgi:hypothetical protein
MKYLSKHNNPKSKEDGMEHPLSMGGLLPPFFVHRKGKTPWKLLPDTNG